MFDSSLRTQLIASSVILMLLVVAYGGMAAYVVSDPAIEHARTLSLAAERVHENYLEEAPPESLIEAVRDGMFGLLDRYSGYVLPESFAQLEEERSGGYSGVGITVNSRPGELFVMDVVPGGPADSAGVLIADRIIGVDKMTFPDTLLPTTGTIRGAEGSSVTLRVYREATDDTIAFQLHRRRVPFRSVPFAGMSRGDALYVPVRDFDFGVHEEIAQVIDSLLSSRDANAPPPSGLIVDLRGNPGGLFSEAYQTAELFFDTATFIVGTRGRSRWHEEIRHAEGHDITDGLPLVLLVDNGTASAAEILAGALQKANRATLIGDTTFGKGLVQGFLRFPDDEGIRLTISRYYFADSSFLNAFDTTLQEEGKGLPPNILTRTDNPFLQFLERSHRLTRFAAIHQSRILTTLAENDSSGASALMSELREFVEKDGGFFYSERTETIDALVDEWRYRYGNVPLPPALDSLVSRSRFDDEDQYEQHARAILARLQEEAVARQNGRAEAFQKISLILDPLIQIADSVLRPGGADAASD